LTFFLAKEVGKPS